MSEEGVFVGSGSFRVDRRKALELLRDKAVEDLAFCPRFWTRAAVAGGATWVRAKGSRGWLSGSSFELRFDGLPFGPELRDPYGALLEGEDPARARARDLALGLLAAGRPGLKEAAVTSGRGRDRMRLRIRPDADDALEPSGDGGLDTVIEVVREASDAGLWAPAETAAAWFGFSPIPVWWDGAELPRRDAGEFSALFEHDGARLRLAVPDELTIPGSTVRLHVRGVLAGVLQRPLGLKADLDLADDRLALNATGTGVVQDERLDRTLAAAAAHVPGFVARMAQEHRSRMEALTARISTASLRRSWTDCMDEYTDAEMLLPRRLRLPWFQEEGREDVRRCLRVACWLRGLCSALTTYSEQAGTPHLKALWEAPIFLAPAGGLLCLRDLDEGGAPLERVALGKAEYDWLRLRYPERV